MPNFNWGIGIGIGAVGTKHGGGPPVGGFLLLQSGGYLLLENGGKIVLE